MNIGYYIFLGGGDYHYPKLINKDWTATWSFDEWLFFVDQLVTLNANTLMVYMNGHKLPYKSKVFPELVDHAHPNVKKEFFSRVLSYAKLKGLSIIGVISTTGHAGGYSELHPEAKIECHLPDSMTEDHLISFPEHMRKGKLIKKSGVAQLGFGALCHNKLLSKIYAENILNEIIELYGSYFDGVALHPPESLFICQCDLCMLDYYAHTNKIFTNSDETLLRKYFITSYFDYQRSKLYPIIKESLKNCLIYTFTIPWFFEAFFDALTSYIPTETIIIDWDYNLEQKRINGAQLRINKYLNHGYKLLFMPTSGFSFNPHESTQIQINALSKQITEVKKSAIEGIVPFLGPKKNNYMQILTTLNK
jgi:hypothetical protein